MVSTKNLRKQQLPLVADGTLSDHDDNSKILRRVTNQLHFRTNSNTILPYLKTKADGRSGHPLFSMNSIISLPKELILPLFDDIIQLSIMNIGVPILDETVKKSFLALWTTRYTGKKERSSINKKAAEVRERLQAEQHRLPQLEVLNQALRNYQDKGFICQFDWCMDHWETATDIFEVTESTFQLPTSCIEFLTIETPPVIAMQQLANTFPSVHFTLLYRYSLEDMWQEVQFHPFPPFGY